MSKNQLDDAIAAFQQATKLDPKLALPHTNLGLALKAQKRLDEAIVEFRKAIELDPKLANAHGSLGLALLLKGQFALSKISTQKALDLLYDKDPARPTVLRIFQQCERYLALEAKLPDVLAGQTRPADDRECLGFAKVCQLQRRNVAATRLYAEALTVESKLAADVKVANRYIAACAAALAGAGQGTDADKLDDKEGAVLRKRALDWLRADLDLHRKQLESGKPPDRSQVHDKLRWWQKDPDLAGIRDQDAVARLPAEERAACRQLWADVAKLLEKASGS